MIIYRVENKDHVGPFHSGFSSTLNADDKKAWYKHSGNLPNPSQEWDFFDYENYVDFVCGTINKRQLNLWFKKFMPQLKNAGYNISRYSVKPENILIGKKQVMFNKNKAKFLSYLQ